MNKKLFCARIFKKIFVRKPIVLVSDRKDKAGDNGEVFFKYLQDKKIISFFELYSDCDDYQRMKQVGKVIAIDSIQHKILLLLADVYISSQIEWYPYRQSEIPYIFLQHGVSDKDISDYLRPHFESRKEGYILASTKSEFESLRKAPYMFGKEHVWLTGLPRFDELHDNSQKIVVLSLTWRSDIAFNGSKNAFLESTYYQDIKRILISESIKGALLESGYKLYIKLHPMMKKYEDLLECPSHVGIWKENYNELFAKCNLLITDYSSILYDFAYLRKPIIYYQPKEEQQQKHVWKMGDFSYEEAGFGEVTHSIEELEKVLCQYLQDDCQLKEKYRKRIDNSFAFHDQKNCERVYQEMMQVIDKKR